MVDEGEAVVGGASPEAPSGEAGDNAAVAEAFFDVPIMVLAPPPRELLTHRRIGVWATWGLQVCKLAGVNTGASRRG